MERDDFLEDDFLKKVMKNLPEDSPSDDFVNKVMAEILPGTEEVKAKSPFFTFLNAAWPYMIITLALLGFLITSDIPFGGLLDKSFFTDTFAPYFSGITESFRTLFEKAGDLSMVFMIAGAALIFFLIDKLFTFRKVAEGAA